MLPLPLFSTRRRFTLVPVGLGAGIGLVYGLGVAIARARGMVESEPFEKFRARCLAAGLAAMYFVYTPVSQARPVPRRAAP